MDTNTDIFLREKVKEKERDGLGHIKSLILLTF